MSVIRPTILLVTVVGVLGISACASGSTGIGAGVCGDGVVNTGEECDDGNTDAGDGCSTDCLEEFCGDGIIQDGLGETCDDGNNTSGDGCDAGCISEWPVGCGNGRPDPGEQCDDGNNTANDGCSPSCRNEVCGDGTLHDGVGEECDDGNTTSGDGCNASCLLEFCGDGTRQPGLGEECDDGNNTSNDGCSATCESEAVCGNLIVEPGEECDDGNTSTNDGCNATCQDEFCGDGIVQSGIGEECDDGNTANGDGCSSTCQDECDPTVNVAPLATPTMSSGGLTSAGYGPENFNDGQLQASCAFAWITASNTPGTGWLRYDWPTPQQIGRIWFDTRASTNGDCTSSTGRTLAGGTVQWWNGSSWVNAGTVSGRTNDWTYNFPTPVTTTRIRIYGAYASTSNPMIFEWRAYCD